LLIARLKHHLSAFDYQVVKPNGNFGSDEQKTMSYQIGKHKGHQINKLDTDKSASED